MSDQWSAKPEPLKCGGCGFDRFLEKWTSTAEICRHPEDIAIAIKLTRERPYPSEIECIRCGKIIKGREVDVIIVKEKDEKEFMEQVEKGEIYQ